MYPLLIFSTPVTKVLILISAPALAASIAMCLSNTFLSRTYPASGSFTSSLVSHTSVPSGVCILTPSISWVTQRGEGSMPSFSSPWIETPSAHLFGDPISDFLSIRITFAPPNAACFAALEPAGPEPTTITSVSIILFSLPF